MLYLLVSLLLATTLGRADFTATSVAEPKAVSQVITPTIYSTPDTETSTFQDTVPPPLLSPLSKQEVFCDTYASLALGTYPPTSTFVMPRDALFPYQWWLNNTGYIPGVPAGLLKPGADAKVVGAWRLLGGYGSSAIRIAVIDAGFDFNNPDLVDRFASSLNAKSAGIACPSGERAGNHGTPCAGIACASANDIGIIGVAPNSQLTVIQGISYSGYVTERAIDHCLDVGVDIISISWGSLDPSHRPSPKQIHAFRRAIMEGRAGRGCIVVVAVGNSGRDYINYYADIPGVIAVGASTSLDTHAAYSNRGYGISVLAPSDGVLPVISTRTRWDEGKKNWPNPFYRDGRDHGPHHKSFGGTSAATPLVAGICALVLSANYDLTAAEVESLLERTADKIGHPAEYDKTGYSIKHGYGRVNAERAIAEALRMRGRSGGGS